MGPKEVCASSYSTTPINCPIIIGDRQTKLKAQMPSSQNIAKLYLIFIFLKSTLKNYCTNNKILNNHSLKVTEAVSEIEI